jgi:hypothetical protein
MNDMQQGPHPFWRSRSAIALVGFGAISVFLLYSEHRAHFLGVLPYLLLLSCPFMHLFMHRGHGAHMQSQSGEKKDSGDSHERSK